jgi:glyoxylase I family protein
MSNLPSVGFHHIALRTQRWDESIRFYCDTLGFTPKVTWNLPSGFRAAMLDAGAAAYLEVFEDPAYVPHPDGAFIHLALRSKDVDADIARIRAAGMRVTVEPKDVTFQTTNGLGPMPIRVAFFAGPNGEIWEFFQNDRT